jgi:membrane protease YdiL (CAAX protease family)
MNDRRAHAVTGFQIAFLWFAIVLLTAPADKFIFSRWQWARDLELPLGRVMIFVIASVVLLAFGSLRRRCVELLRPRIRTGSQHQVLVGLVLNLVSGAGALGAFALWNWTVGGEPALARVMGERATHSTEMTNALSTHGLVMFLFLAATLGPIVEEVVFRGMLYPAWRHAWGWVWGAFGSALVFGLFHGTFLPQFFAGLILVCVLRLTGSLRGSIYMHALSNLLLWYPLLGQFMLPSGRFTGELLVWTPHLICLGLTFILLPWYMWSARDSRLPSSAGDEQGQLFER